jgi:protocatechuate 3,4-dioxygenase beta subunit
VARLPEFGGTLPLMRGCAVRLLSVLLVAGGALSAQTPVPAVELTGTVVVGETKRPISGAELVAARVGGPLSEYRTVTTDQAGRFTFRNLAAGSYRIFAQHENYLATEFGRRTPRRAAVIDTSESTGTPITLSDRQTAPPIVIALMPPGVIVGRVLDGDGRPARLVVVRALKPVFFNGVRTLSSATWTQTDDRGEYRLFGLVPGLYYVSASPAGRPRIAGGNVETPQMPMNANGNRSMASTPLTAESLSVAALDPLVYPGVYHPGTSDVSLAQPLEVRAGVATTAATLSIQPVRAFRVRGRVAGRPADGPSRPVRVAINAPGVASVETVDGTFDLPGVPPGRYRLTAQASATAPWLGGNATVEVTDRDVDEIVLTVQASVAVTGTLTIDGRVPTTADGALAVQLQASTGLLGLGAQRVQPDGTFTFATVVPGDYRFRVLQAPRAPWIASATFGREDVLDTPVRIEAENFGRRLEIALSTRTATLDVQVFDDDRRPVAGVLVVAVPDTARRSRSTNFRTARTDSQGRAHLADVAPGEYLLFASDEVDVDGWQDPDILRRYQARGELVRLPEQGAANVTLRLLR